MKKILLASTVLAMTSTLASAEISFSGYGRFGLDYNSAATGTESETQVNMRMRVNINMSVETDAGIEFGGRIRLQYTDGNSSSTLSPAYLYAEASGFRMEIGNANTAFDSAALMYNAEIGYLDRSFGDPQFTFYSFASTSYGGESDRMGYFVSYSVGDLNARISLVDPDQTFSGDDPELSVSADYAFGPVTVSAAYADNGEGVASRDHLFLGAEYGFNDVGNVGILYNEFNTVGTTLDSSRVTLYGNYTFDAITVAAYVASDDADSEVDGESSGPKTTDTAYGLGVSYDLGGARAAFDIHQDYSEETIAGLGVRFDF